MKQKSFFFISIFLAFIAFPIFSEDLQSIDFPLRRFPPARSPHKESINYNGRKMPPHREEIFAVIGVKIDEVGEYFSISVFFNDAIDTNSILSHEIFINDQPLPIQTEFLFNKSRRMMQFLIKKQPENFTFKINEAFSFDRRPLKSTEIQNLGPNCFFKYSPTEQKWQENHENQKF